MGIGVQMIEKCEYPKMLCGLLSVNYQLLKLMMAVARIIFRNVL